MLRNLTKGARLVKAPARFFGAHAHHAAKMVAAPLSEETVAARAKFVADGNEIVEYKFPNVQIDYDHLHFVNPQITYTEEGENFIYAPLEPSAESAEKTLKALFANNEVAYNETLKEFPATAAGEAEKAQFVELFEPIIFPHKALANPENHVDMAGSSVQIDSYKGTPLPHGEMGFLDTMVYSFISGNRSNQVNYAVGLVVSGVSCAYIFYRGFAEISELFDLMAHGHDHH